MNTLHGYRRMTETLLLTSLLCLVGLMAMANDDANPPKPTLTNNSLTQRLLPELFPLPAPSLKVTTITVFDYDPIRFTISADKDSVAIGEDITLTITADLLPISSSMLFFFEEQRGFSLKILFPKGFQQTGGTYQDGISEKLMADSKTHAEYTIQGHFTDIISIEMDFKLLRGSYGQVTNNIYQRKASVRLYAKINTSQNISPKANIVAKHSILKNNNAIFFRNAVVPTPLTIIQPAYDCNTGIFSFNTLGGDSSTIQYMAPGITGWTTQQTGFIIQPGCDALPLTLFARQSGIVASYTWDWIKYCQSVNNPPAHIQSVVTPAAFTALIGKPFSYTFPSGVFEDPENQPLIYSMSGLPTGLSFVSAEGIIAGIPLVEGNFTLNYKATDNVCSTVAISLTLSVVSCTQPQPPTITSSQSDLCPGQSVTLTASGCPNGAIHWSTGTTGSLLIVSSTGFYWAKCLQNDCTSQSNSINIGSGSNCCSSQPLAPQLVASQSVICTGQSVTITANGCSTGTVIWATGHNGNTLITSSAGSYSANCTLDGCTSETVFITITEGVACATLPTSARIYTRSNPGYNLMYRYVGGYFQGSNDQGPIETKNWQTLATILTEPIENEWNNYSFSPQTIPYRFLRFVAGPESYGELMELEFYSGNKKLPDNIKFGSESVYNNQASYTYTNAFDSNTTTMWHGAIAGNSNFIGIDTDGNAANNPTSNTAITLPALTALVGTSLVYTLPSNTFIAPKGQLLTYHASGLPNNLAINDLTISGLVTASDTYTVTLTATNPSGATASRTLLVMVTDSAMPFKVLAPSYTCETGRFYFNATGGNGDTIYYRAVGITGWTTTSGPFTVLPFADAQPFNLQVRQNDIEYTYTWDWKAACTTSQ